MKVTIIQDDNAVYIDGAARKVDLSGLDPSIHALQFNTDTGKGHIEFDQNLDPLPPNEQIDSEAFAARFAWVITRWEEAPDPEAFEPNHDAPAPEGIIDVDQEIS